MSKKDLNNKRYRELQGRTFLRLALTYLAPFVLLTVYFHIQSGRVVKESRFAHLRQIAEQQANTLDLFLRERIVNLTNLIDDPKLQAPKSNDIMQSYLERLKRSSDTFVDVGYFDSTGIQTSYAGPFPSLEQRNYGSESWFVSLKDRPGEYIITDIYLGFRGKPHFTIGVSRIREGKLVVLRATLDPERIYDYLISHEGVSDVLTSIVNDDGYYQVVTPHFGTLLEESSIIPPSDPNIGVQSVTIQGRKFLYGYSWLKSASWAVIAQWSEPNRTSWLLSEEMRVVLVSFVIIAIIFIVIVIRSKQLVHLQEETDQTKVQLEHASKLASVGELAAGIAHEINNPLAIISEEAGLMKDLMDPKFKMQVTEEEQREHLDEIHKAVFRCRDITRKLLGFVRQTDIQLKPHNITRLIDEVVDGFLTRELAASNIEIERLYEKDIPPIITDANQLEQVLLNIINNGIDALEERPGRITLQADFRDGCVEIHITDTGKGMTPEELNKIFLPFFTTKEVGKGTGLGLSVSYSIVKSLGGKILVKSVPGAGTTFSIVLPVN